MKITNYDNYLASLKNYSESFDLETDKLVLDIIDNVRKNGDSAVYDYAKQFDKVDLDSLIVSQAEIELANQTVSDNFKQAMQQAAKNINEFHEKQVEQSWYYHKPDGIMLGQQVTALDRVGVYVPGGKAAYPSTVLMNVLPAKIAGVAEIYMTTPPQADGSINPHILYAASLAGVDRIYKIGGAQAVAAYAYGTESVIKVDKIVGPGNKFVARAKKWVYGDVAIDMIAGPSEICVVADETAPAKYVAADLLSQAEHDEAARAICITTQQSIADEINKEVTSQLKELDRVDIAQASIDNHGVIIVVETLDKAFELVNEIAPEHLQLMLNNATEALPQIKHAGAIFIGNHSPEPLGDYLAGPNHTLPTSGTAKFASPLGVYDFTKKSSVIRYSEAALNNASNDIIEIATMEGLTGHANSIKLRQKKGDS